jgi:hypothetical protein
MEHILFYLENGKVTVWTVCSCSLFIGVARFSVKAFHIYIYMCIYICAGLTGKDFFHPSFLPVLLSTRRLIISLMCV